MRAALEGSGELRFGGRTNTPSGELGRQEGFGSVLDDPAAGRPSAVSVSRRRSVWVHGAAAALLYVAAGRLPHSGCSMPTRQALIHSRDGRLRGERPDPAGATQAHLPGPETLPGQTRLSLRRFVAMAHSGTAWIRCDRGPNPAAIQDRDFPPPHAYLALRQETCYACSCRSAKGVAPCGLALRTSMKAVECPGN